MASAAIPLLILLSACGTRPGWLASAELAVPGGGDGAQGAAAAEAGSSEEAGAIAFSDAVEPDTPVVAEAGTSEEAGAVAFSDAVEPDTAVVFKLHLRVDDVDQVSREVPLLVWADTVNLLGLHPAAGASTGGDGPAVLLVAFVHVDDEVSPSWSHEATLAAGRWYDIEITVSPGAGTVSVSLDGESMAEGHVPLSDAVNFNYASEWSASDGFEVWLEDARTVHVEHAQPTPPPAVDPGGPGRRP